MLKKILRWSWIALATIFVLAQFLRPEKTNPAIEQGMPIQRDSTVPPQIIFILTRSCFDCHTNETRWPWYSNLTPVNFLIVNDVNTARKHINFSNWLKYKPLRRQSLLQEIYDQIYNKEMPLPRYVPLHPEAKLSDDERKTLLDWTEAAQKQMADSLQQ